MANDTENLLMTIQRQLAGGDPILMGDKIVEMFHTGQVTKAKLKESLEQIQGKITPEARKAWWNFIDYLTGDLETDLELVRKKGIYFADSRLGKQGGLKFGTRFDLLGRVQPEDPPEMFNGFNTASNEEFNFCNTFAGAANLVSSSKLFERCHEMAPAVWDKFTPRVYKGVDKWEDYRHFSAYATSAVEYMRRYPTEYDKDTWCSPSGMLERALIGSVCAEHDVPLMFVNSDLLSAARMTYPPDEVDWSQMRLPHEGMVFVMPKGAFESSQGGAISFISFARIRANKEVALPVSGDKYQMPKDLFIVTGLDALTCFDYTRILVSPFEYHGRMPVKIRYEGEVYDNPAHSVNQLDILGKPGKADDVKTLKHGSLDTTRWKPEDIETSEEIVKVLMNLLLLMEAQPEVVEKPESENYRKLGHHKKTRAELWTPNVLGRRYRIIKGDVDHGSHASPRWHWRRGHWREQGSGRLICYCSHGRAAHDKETKRCRYTECLDKCHGARYKHEEHNRTWIEPILVAFTEVNDEKTDG